MKIRTLLALIMIAGSSSGCGTLLRTLVPARQLGVASRPEGATVTLDGKEVGTTPCTIRLPHTSAGLIAFQLEGYETCEVAIPKRNYWAVFLYLVPIFFYPIIVLILHNNDSDVSWRDDLAEAAGISLGLAAGGLMVDFGSGSNKVFPKHIPSIEVVLIKRRP